MSSVWILYCSDSHPLYICDTKTNAALLLADTIMMDRDRRCPSPEQYFIEEYLLDIPENVGGDE